MKHGSKTIAIISKDAELHHICRAIDSQRMILSERIKFLQKQVDDAQKSHAAAVKSMWNDLEARLKKTDALPADHDPKKTGIHFNLDEDFVKTTDRCTPGGPAGVQGFLMSLGGMAFMGPGSDDGEGT